MDSNTASVMVISWFSANRKGREPVSPSTPQNITTTRNPSRTRKSWRRFAYRCPARQAESQGEDKGIGKAHQGAVTGPHGDPKGWQHAETEDHQQHTEYPLNHKKMHILFSWITGRSHRPGKAFPHHGFSACPPGTRLHGRHSRSWCHGGRSAPHPPAQSRPMVAPLGSLISSTARPTTLDEFLSP